MFSPAASGLARMRQFGSGLVSGKPLKSSRVNRVWRGGVEKYSIQALLGPDDFRLAGR
jgi:hypothetical protein